MLRKLVEFGLVACLPLLLVVAACTSKAPSATQVEGEMPMTAEPGKKEMSDMTGKVTAEVVLRSADGSSILDAKEAITAETIAKYRVEKEVIDKVSSKLNELGFDVLQAGPTSLTISGDKSRFESMFQTTLETRSKEIMGTKVEGAEASYYEALEPIVVPDDLSDLVADVILATPPEFFP